MKYFCILTKYFSEISKYVGYRGQAEFWTYNTLYSFYGPTKIKIPKADLKTRDQSGSENWHY